MPRYFFYSSITFLVSTYSCLAESIYRQDLECLTKNKSYTKSIKILADEACNAFEKFEINKSDKTLKILLYTLSCGKAPFKDGVPKALLSFQGICGDATYCDYQIVTWILEKTYNMCPESFKWINQYGENADFINFYKRYLDIVNYKISKEELEKAIKIVQQKKEEERNKTEEEKKKREAEEKKRKEEEDRNRKEAEKKDREEAQQKKKLISQKPNLIKEVQKQLTDEEIKKIQETRYDIRKKELFDKSFNGSIGNNEFLKKLILNESHQDVFETKINGTYFSYINWYLSQEKFDEITFLKEFKEIHKKDSSEYKIDNAMTAICDFAAYRLRELHHASNEIIPINFFFDLFDFIKSDVIIGQNNMQYLSILRMSTFLEEYYSNSDKLKLLQYLIDLKTNQYDLLLLYFSNCFLNNFEREMNDSVKLFKPYLNKIFKNKIIEEEVISICSQIVNICESVMIKEIGKTQEGKQIIIYMDEKNDKTIIDEQYKTINTIFNEFKDIVLNCKDSNLKEKIVNIIKKISLDGGFKYYDFDKDIFLSKILKEISYNYDNKAKSISVDEKAFNKIVEELDKLSNDKDFLKIKLVNQLKEIVYIANGYLTKKSEEQIESINLTNNSPYNAKQIYDTLVEILSKFKYEASMSFVSDAFIKMIAYNTDEVLQDNFISLLDTEFVNKNIERQILIIKNELIKHKEIIANYKKLSDFIKLYKSRLTEIIKITKDLKYNQGMLSDLYNLFGIKL